MSFVVKAAAKCKVFHIIGSLYRVGFNTLCEMLNTLYFITVGSREFFQIQTVFMRRDIIFVADFSKTDPCAPAK